MIDRLIGGYWSSIRFFNSIHLPHRGLVLVLVHLVDFLLVLLAHKMAFQLKYIRTANCWKRVTYLWNHVCPSVGGWLLYRRSVGWLVGSDRYSRKVFLEHSLSYWFIFLLQYMLNRQRHKNYIFFIYEIYTYLKYLYSTTFRNYHCKRGSLC